MFDCLRGAGTNSDCSLDGGILIPWSEKESLSGGQGLDWVLEFAHWARSFRIRGMGASGWWEIRSKIRGEHEGGSESAGQTGIKKKVVRMVGWSQGDGVTLGDCMMRENGEGGGQPRGIAPRGRGGGWASPRSLAGPRDETVKSGELGSV